MYIVHPAMRLPPLTQLAVYCVLQIHLSDVLVVNSSGETVPTELYPEMMRNVQLTFVLLYFGHYIIFRTRIIIWTF